MACGMQMKSSPVRQQWQDIFPDFTTITGSSMFIKKLMAVSLSSITYLRGIFPDKAYGERQLGGIKLKLLSEDCRIEGVIKFINLIRSLYDAVDKKYLYQLNIGISTDIENRDNVLESYNMNFRYREDEFKIENKSSSAKLSGKDPTVEATFTLLKGIFIGSDMLQPLPKNAYLTMKLLYHDDITPPDYEPLGFEPCESDKFSFPPSVVKVGLGKVSTDFHRYEMYLKTVLSEESLSQMIEESSQSDFQTSTDKIQAKDANSRPIKDIIQEPEKFQNVAEESEETIDCPCTCKLDSGLNIITCSSCGKKQHSICYGYLEAVDHNSEFYCILCINEVPYRNSQEDPVYSYDGEEQMEFCAFRRSLVYCSSLKYLTLVQLEKHLKCDTQMTETLIERLQLEGFIRKSAGKYRYIVDAKKITSSGYQEYFHTENNKENAENSEKNLPKSTIFDKAENSSNLRRKPIYKRAEKAVLSGDNFMNFAIDKEVEKLNLKGSTDRQHCENLRRRNLHIVSEDDPDVLHNQPRKRHCLSTKEIIPLHYTDEESSK